MDRFLWIPFLALVLTVLFHILALQVFPLFGLLDFPERYGLKRAQLPYPTGIIAVLVFLGFGLAIERPSMQFIGLVCGVAMLGIVSFVDDRRPLHPVLRLLTQTAVALLIFASGTRIYTLTNPLEGIAGLGGFLKLDIVDIPTSLFGPLPLWSGVFTLVWLGLTINALNWFDGIPGQVTVLSTIGFLTIGFLSVSDRVDRPELAMLAFILAGLSAGSALFDLPPPRVVLGDTGSMFFGLMLGVLTIYAGGKVATAFLVLGVPLIDSAIVIVLRILKGKSPMKGSLSGEHLHHRLLAKGWTARQVIALTAVLGSAFGTTALFLSTREKFASAVILLAVMLVLEWYSKTNENTASQKMPHPRRGAA